MNSFNYKKKREAVKNRILTARLSSVYSLLIALLSFFIIAWTVFINEGRSLDEKVFAAISPHITDSRTKFMLFISFLGNHTFLIPANLLLIIFFVARNKKGLAIRVGIVALANVFLMSLLKRYFHRLRPEHPLVEGITNFSFPSGHAFMSVAFYGFLMWYAAVSIDNKRIERSIIVFFLLVIFAIGFSRIYLRVHYATDVLAGFCIGFAFLMVCLWLTDKLQEPREIID